MLSEWEINDTNDSKLLTNWQDRFEVQKKLGPTTYQVITPGL